MFRPAQKDGLGKIDFECATTKRTYNRHLFDVVAPVYQKVTAVLSFGQDTKWKRGLVAWLPVLAQPVCIDLACGTGDLLELLCRRYGGGTIVGVDQNLAMINAGRRIPNRKTAAQFVRADMNALPFPDRCADILTAGYAIRNAPNLDVALGEIARILKPGGVAAILDFSRPASRPLSRLQLALLGIWGRLWGRIFHRNGAVYGYIAKSLAHFPDREALTRSLASHGLQTIRTARPFLGFLELRVVRKNDCTRNFFPL